MSEEKITIAELMDMFAEIFEVNVGDISFSSHRDDIEGWDSMGVLSLMAEYDSRFGITFTADQLEEFETIHDLVEVLKRVDKVEV